VHKVLLERRSERDLRKLPAEIFHRIVPQLKSLSENPHPSGCRKITGSENAWRIRVGEYRIVYESETLLKGEARSFVLTRVLRLPFALNNTLCQVILLLKDVPLPTFRGGKIFPSEDSTILSSWASIQHAL
jgi:mRNA interferase RelE/StbE